MAGTMGGTRDKGDGGREKSRGGVNNGRGNTANNEHRSQSFVKSKEGGG